MYVIRTNTTMLVQIVAGYYCGIPGNYLVALKLV